jgi:hypothetical protein
VLNSRQTISIETITANPDRSKLGNRFKIQEIAGRTDSQPSLNTVLTHRK